jgi:hypothetical protein
MTKEKATELNIHAKNILNSFHYTDYLTKKGWAKLYVEAEEPIPEEWKDDFLEELTSPNLDYRQALEESVRWFGVRWEKGGNRE